MRLPPLVWAYSGVVVMNTQILMEIEPSILKMSKRRNESCRRIVWTCVEDVCRCVCGCVCVDVCVCVCGCV